MNTHTKQQLISLFSAGIEKQFKLSLRDTYSDIVKDDGNSVTTEEVEAAVEETWERWLSAMDEVELKMLGRVYDPQFPEINVPSPSKNQL